MHITGFESIHFLFPLLLETCSKKEKIMGGKSLLFVLLVIGIQRCQSYEVGNMFTEFKVKQGQATYKLPVTPPKGFPSHLLELDLLYDSAAGNGPLGLGWTIGGLSQITRCAQTPAQDGRRRGIMYESGDRFCLDGSRLVLTSGVYGAAGSTYGTELDTFSRTYAAGIQGRGPQSFLVRTKNNQKLSFGTRDNSRAKAHGQKSIHAWKLDSIRDYTSNVVSISYVDNTNGFLVAKISYKKMLIRFDYEARKDVSSQYFNGGVLYKEDKRLKSVKTFVNGQVHREIKITYVEAKTTKLSVVTSIQLCSRQSKCFKPVRFGYQGTTDVENAKQSAIWIKELEASNGWKVPDHPRYIVDVNDDGLADVVGFGSNGVQVALNQNGCFKSAKTWVSSFGTKSGGWNERYPRHIADVNGDHLSDIVGFKDKGVYVSLNTGSQSFAPPRLWSTQFGYTAGGWRVEKHPRFVNDMNGDGLPDIVGFANDGVSVSLGTGTSFNKASRWVASFGFTAGGWQVQKNPRFLADVNGDGLPDVVGMGNGGVYVSISTGYSFLSPAYWGKGYFGYEQGWRTDQHPRIVVDVNGDGLADIVGFSCGGVEVSLSTGTGFLPPKTWISEFGYRQKWRVNDHPRYIHDMNGDGLPDVVGFAAAGVIVALNTGSSFAPGKTWVSGYVLDSKSHYPRYLADVTGDGISDIVGMANAAVSISTNNNKQTLMTSETDSYGNIQQVLYSSLADKSIYTRGQTSTYPNPKVNIAQTVVKQMKQSNGLGGLNSTKFAYKGMRMNFKGRGPLGFEEVTETGLENKESVTTKYFQIFPLAALIKSVARRVASKLTFQSDKAYRSTGGRQKHVYLIDDAVKYYELNGQPVKDEHLSVKEVDSYGNIKRMKKITTGNGMTFEQTTLNSYSNTPGTWFIGQLDAIVVSHKTSSGTMNRKTRFSFNRNTRKLMYEVREPNHKLGLKISYVYDHHGNVIEKREAPLISSAGNGPRSVIMTYDSLGVRLLSSRNNLGHVERYAYDSYGNIVSLTGANGLVTRYTYDAFDRKTLEVRPDGTSTKRSLQFVGQKSSPHGGVYTENTTVTGGQDTLKVYDSFDRLRRTVSTGFKDSVIYEEIQYGPFGNVKRQSLPYFPKHQQPVWITFQYDSIGREVTMKRPSGEFTTARKRTVYNGLVTETTNAKGNTKRTERDALGRIIQVTDSLNGTVKYEYNAVGNLIKTTDPAGHTVVMNYDQLGNKISMNDPDMGYWQYSYDAHGQKIRQTDSVGNEKTYTYDKLGRLTETQDPEGETKWIYDQGPNSKGKVIKSQSPNGHTMEYTYDSKGRETVVRQYSGGETFQVKSEYNHLGQLSKQTLPGSKTVHYCYDDQGFMTEVRKATCGRGSASNIYWKALDYDSFGHIAKEQFANSLVTEYSFDSSNHLKSIKTLDSAKREKRNWQYSYDAVGNMLERKDLTKQWNTVEKFTYDALDRIIRATIKSLDPKKEAELSEDWEYDSIGNIRRYSGFGGLYHHYSTAKPHAIVKAGPNTYAYDANGNVIRKNNQTITWTPFNKVKTIQTQSKGIVRFEYGANQARVKKSSCKEILMYVGKLYEKETALPRELGKVTHKYFIYALGKLVAIDSKVETKSASQSAVNFLHGDHLDSIDTISNEKGEIVESLRYTAFGRRRSTEWTNCDGCRPPSQDSSAYTKRGFTGHEHLEDLDLVHMNGRIYDPDVGRFLSPDPHVQDPYNTQSYNRYSYTLNNPLKHKDPSGYFFKAIGRFFKKYWRPIVAIAASVLTFGAATPIAAGLVASAGLTGVTASVATGVLAGAASGFVGGTIASGSIKGGLQGALGGAISGGVGGYFGNTWNVERVATQAISGGVSTELSGGEFKDGFLMAGITASARYLYNSVVDYDVEWKPGGPAHLKGYKDMPIKGANNIGTQGQTINPFGWFNEGGRLSRFLNKIPGVNAVSGMHDVFQVSLDRVQFPFARDIFNVPGMLPAAALAYAALIDGPAAQALLVEKKTR